ncbi:MAG: L-serine ammonia-lyase, iron-sulfur-dependent, subunit alpha [Anaerolineales bacterium]|nr:L-serine ammonia-lyase, iron-sulfur-dependent, subunit alpha [Anaerolineales bacterium]
MSTTPLPSIFNDVIGPVMRGPSSSHCAAALRIGRLARDLMGGEIERLSIEFDARGSLATTHASQGSDMGICGGLLGWEATDERLAASPAALQEAGIEMSIEIKELGDPHPNTYRLSLHNANEAHRMLALSTGGGMIQVIEIDGAPLAMGGDYYETLLYLETSDAAAGEAARQFLLQRLDADAIRLLNGNGQQIIEIQADRFPDEKLLSELGAGWPLRVVKRLAPVMPVLSRRDIQLPFSNCQQMLAYNHPLDLPLWELAARYEAQRGGLSEAQVFERMRAIVEIMQASIREALHGNEYTDRILGCQSGGFREGMDSGKLLPAGALNQVILYTSAMMEQKSAMGVIVAAPTAGACGGLPGAVIGAADALGLSIDAMTRAMLAAGLVGVFIASQATFAAEVCGCQAECGAGSCMAAAALAELAGASAQQAINAASLALQNVIGLVCDPVANRVEVPCLGRNVMAAANALACANMALASYDPVIPLDEVIQAMYAVGQSLPVELRCTGLGGLSITPTSKAIERRLDAAH